jgi:alpha-galactosidase/6-phospho-beta-glucosidase family protein
MRTYTTEHTVYSYDELSESAKEVARAWWVDGLQYDDLSDAMHERLGELLQEYKMKCNDAHAFYSLSYSQGDGAMFTGNVSYKGYTFTVEHYGHYYHYNSKQITAIERNNGNNISDETWSKMFKDFEAQYVALCKDLEKYGYDYIEYEQEREVVEDNIRANEYEFYENGALA